MGQMGPKMTLGTLIMSGDDFTGVWGVLRGSNSVHNLISDIYRRHSDTVYCPLKGGCQRDNSWPKSFLLENKVVINLNFRYGAKKSGHTLQIYNYKRVKEWREVTFMKEWVKPLYIGYLQALDLPQNLFPLQVKVIF